MQLIHAFYLPQGNSRPCYPSPHPTILKAETTSSHIIRSICLQVLTFLQGSATVGREDVDCQCINSCCCFFSRLSNVDIRKVIDHLHSLPSTHGHLQLIPQELFLASDQGPTPLIDVRWHHLLS